MDAASVANWIVTGLVGVATTALGAMLRSVHERIDRKADRDLVDGLARRLDQAQRDVIDLKTRVSDVHPTREELRSAIAAAIAPIQVTIESLRQEISLRNDAIERRLDRIETQLARLTTHDAAS